MLISVLPIFVVSSLSFRNRRIIKKYNAPDISEKLCDLHIKLSANAYEKLSPHHGLICLFCWIFFLFVYRNLSTVCVYFFFPFSLYSTIFTLLVQWVINKLLLLLTIISVCLKSKSLLQKEIHGDFENRPETPPQWRQIKMKSTILESEWAKTIYREITVPHLEQQGKSLFLHR